MIKLFKELNTSCSYTDSYIATTFMPYLLNVNVAFIIFICLVTGAAGGIMGWTARAGSFVVEKMNIFSYTESVPNTSIAHKQPSFLER